MNQSKVLTSIILTVIMILGTLSFSLIDLTLYINELNEEETIARSTSNNSFDSLVLQTSYYDSNENPGYIGTTYDDRVIVYSEEQDSNGRFNIAISVHSYPDQGFQPPRSPLSIQIHEMNLDREILLPLNFSKMRPCTPILHPDDYISLVCSFVSGQSTNEDLRLDFNSTYHTVTKRGGSMFLWDANDSLVNFLPLNGTLQGSNPLYSTKPMFNVWNGRPVSTTYNFTYIGLTKIVASGNLELNGTTYSCPTSMSNGCRAIYEFDRDGTILNIVFSEYKYSSGGECYVYIDDVSSDNNVELKETGSYGCEFRSVNNNLLFETASTTNRPQGGNWIVLDSNLTLLKHFPSNYKCGTTLTGNYKSEIYDIESTPVGIAYFADTHHDCANNNRLGTLQQSLHGTNVSNLNGGSWTKAIITVGMLNYSSTSFESSTTIDWRYTWALDSSYTSSNSISPKLKWFDQNKLYWVGSYNSGTATVVWNSELGGRNAPNINPSNSGIGNEMASIFSLNGIWLQSISKAQGTCSQSNNFIDFQSTRTGFSCAVRTDSRAGAQSFSVFDIDTDGDGYAKDIDAFPNISSQQYDTDLDGYGDDPFGYQADSCVAQPGNSTTDRYGCTDLDGDGTSDLTDPFVLDPSQFADTDNDGYGDNVSGFRGDSCPLVFGESARNSTYGCPDADFDGWADFEDSFPYDSSQWSDWDGDGFGDELIGVQGDSCPSQYGNSTIDRFGCIDNDGDGYSNSNDDFPDEPSQHQDSDGDGYGNNQTIGALMPDAFPYDASQWNDSDGDGHGDNPFGSQGDWFPTDPNRWQDSDQDGYADEDDAFINDATQWNDSDGDGYGDEESGNRPDIFPMDPNEWEDTDGDGYGNNGDAFPSDGTQWNDSDNDGHGDNPYGTLGDWFPNDPTKWQDSDQDGYADENDAFINDPSQWNDSDGDGYGDDANGSRADEFPDDPLEWQDSDGDGFGDNGDAFPVDGTQWNDTDGDGYGDNPYGTQGDWFPEDPLRWQDSDLDGVADEDDAFPNERSQSEDMDGDGYGDNPDGENPDAFPSNPDEWQDTDGDFVGNNEDAFPFDPSQQSDSDGDGFGDNPMGNGADRFPGDSSQWMDIDGDGYGDNPLGTFADAFITDPTQWSDIDGDGFGDNPGGRQADAFPDDPTQWEDLDGDGLGDSDSGNNPDPFLFDFDNDGYNDSIDPLPKLASPGDLDNDGVLDEDDLFPEDFREWADSDEDGTGDNADTDDDNDGWSDADELREGTNPFSSSEQPIDSFEIVIPGTAVGLGAWDLIGIFGGVPLFAWIGFGFITRNGRTAKYEEKLRNANSRDELEDVARQWEYSLMLRMLGPHQGIRLERLRAELDDVFERQNQTLSSLEKNEFNQTHLVQDEIYENEKQVPEIDLKPAIDAVGNPDEKGYEWIKSKDGKDWYRTQGTTEEWIEFSD